MSYLRLKYQNCPLINARSLCVGYYTKKQMLTLSIFVIFCFVTKHFNMILAFRYSRYKPWSYRIFWWLWKLTLKDFDSWTFKSNLMINLYNVLKRLSLLCLIPREWSNTVMKFSKLTNTSMPQLSSFAETFVKKESPMILVSCAHRPWIKAEVHATYNYRFKVYRHTDVQRNSHLTKMLKEIYLYFLEASKSNDSSSNRKNNNDQCNGYFLK